MKNELYEMMNDKMISDIERIAAKNLLKERGMKDVKILIEELQTKYNLSQEKVNQLIRIRLKQLIDNDLIKENLKLF
jgi:hypothetical protein